MRITQIEIIPVRVPCRADAINSASLDDRLHQGAVGARRGWSVQFDELPKSRPQVARTLQFAVAYNAVTLVPHHSCQKKEWCLLELGGVALLKYGLTLKRGGFVKGNVKQLAEFVVEASA